MGGGKGAGKLLATRRVWVIIPFAPNNDERGYVPTAATCLNRAEPA